MEVYLDHLKGERAGALDRFSKDVLRVGRNAEFELCFDDLGVSFEHAELRVRDGDFWLVDRGSTNGSYVNEERAYNARLRDGDVVRFGKKGPVVRFTLQKPRPEESAAASREVPDAAEDRPSQSDEPLADLPPLAPAPEIGVPAKKVRSRRLTVPSMAALEPAPLPERAPEPPRIAVRPAAPPDSVSSSEDDLSSGGSSALEDRRAGERRISIMPRQQARGFWMALGALSLCTVFFAGAATMFYIDADRKAHQWEETRHDLDSRTKELDEVKKEKADAEQEWQARETRETEVARRTVENLEDSLRRERDEAKKSGRASQQKIEDLQQQLARAQGELTKFAVVNTGGGDGRAWKMIQKRLARSIVLVAVSFNLKRKDGSIEPKVCYGSGFFISKDGHIITNKHVIEPWKFRPMAIQLANEDLEVDMKSYSVAVWIAETRFASGAQLDLTTGYSTQAKTLEKLRTPRDVMTAVSSGDKGSRSVLIHNDNSNEDLALLKATGGPFEPIPLRRASDGPIEKLDQVMVLGFPAGPSILEKGIAETSPSIGQIRKVEETIYVNASIMGGNSGGPLVDNEGRVIGVATRIVNAANSGTEVLGICLKVEHVIDLYGDGS